MREGCYKEGAKSKTYSVTIKSTEHIEQGHEYDTASSAGLFGMEIQGATAMFAVNLKRILTLLKEKE